MNFFKTYNRKTVLNLQKTEGTSKINYTYVLAVICKEGAHQNTHRGFLD